MLKDAEEDLRRARRRGDAEDEEAAKVEIALLDAVIKKLETFGVGFDQLGGELARSTGLAADRVAKMFEEGALGVESVNGQLSIAGVEIEKVGDRFTAANLPEKAREAVDAQTIFNDVLRETQEGFEAGALNSDKLSAKIAGLSSQILKIKEGGGS